MALEIPVIVDIDKAFQEASNQVPDAIKVIQQKINDNVLEVPVEINKKGELREVIDFVGKTTLSMDELKMAIKSASSELTRLKRKGASKEDIETYQQALLLLKAIKVQWDEELKASQRFGDAQLKNIQLTREYEQALKSSANTLGEMNSKIATYTTVVNNSDIGSEKFREAARALYEMSTAASQVQAQVSVFGARTGSIDQLNAKLRELNIAWNSMSAQDKFINGQSGKMTAEAERLYAEYKKITKELKAEVMSMSDMNAKEQERVRRVKEYLAQRQKEKQVLESNAKTIAALEAKISILRQRLETSPIGSKVFSKLNQELKDTQAQLDSVRRKIDGVDEGLAKTDNMLGRLVKKSLYLFGLHTIGRFLRNVREVTAEFEMQRVALGGIIHDTEEANKLFRQIKAAAVESPFQIKELVTYTKQLSAYRVETENLFGVTMKLADISAALGVSMDRLVLAYGQVRAASVLRGQELRQFTEAGIPLVEELAKKFTILNGRLVTTSEVFELISKRAVPFEMISEIFDDMTEKGGVFYKMQEKQAETLLGQWNNLKDALSIMYDEMGNTTVVHKGMEALINDAKYLMQNWRVVRDVLKTVVIQFGAVKFASLFIPTLTKNTELAEKATRALERAERLEAMQQTKQSALRNISIKQLKAYAVQMEKAAAAHTKFGRGWRQLTAFMAGGGWIGLASTAISVLIGFLVSASNEAHRLEKELSKIGSDGATSINRSVSNFKRLAEAAVSAADGSNEQNEALSELQRTYSDIIPSQNMQIKKLRELKGDYDSLTSAIEQKINMQIKEQKINAVTDFYSGKIQKGRKSAKNLLVNYGLDKEQINAVFGEMQKAIDDGMITATTSIGERAEIIEDIINKLTGLNVKLTTSINSGTGIYRKTETVASRAANKISELSDLYINLHEETQEIENDMSAAIGTMGIYAKSWDNLKKEIKRVTVSVDEFGDSSTFTYKKEKIRKEVEVLARAIEDAFKNTGIDITDAIKPEGTIDFDAISKAASESKRWGLDSYIKSIRESYEAIVPSDQMVGVVERKFKEFADAAGVSMDEIQGYLFSGKKDIRDYVKDLQGDLQEAQDEVKKFQLVKEDSPFLVDQKALDRWTAVADILEKVINWLTDFKKKGPSASYAQDPYIKLMQDRMKFMQDFKRGYDDLNKYMASSGALEKQLDVMKERGLSLGIDTPDQKMAARELSEWYSKTIDEAFEKAKKRGATGTVESFLSEQIGDKTNKGKALRDFQSLIRSLWDAKTDLDTSRLKNDLEAALKRVTEEVKRSDTARNFFQNILDATGDKDLAVSMTVSVYGDIGEEFKARMQRQLDRAFSEVDMDSMSDELFGRLSSAVATQDYDTILANLDAFPEKWRDVLMQMAADDEKYYASMASDLVKSLKSVQTYGDKRVEIARKSAERLRQIEEMNADPVTKQELRKANAKKEAQETAKIAYEAFKDTPMYVELFANLDHASTTMLQNMRGKILAMKEQWKDLSPVELKEMQSRLEEIDRQLARKNPFAELIASVREYSSMVKKTSRKEAEENAIAKDEALKQEQEKLDLSIRNLKEAEKTYGVESNQAKVARRAMEYQKERTDAAEEEAQTAQDAAALYRDIANRIAGAADAMQEWAGYINTALGGIGEIVETFGSEDTIDTFNIISEGVGKTLGGVQKTASGFARVLAGDFTGIADIVAGVGDVIAGVFGTGSKLRIAEINKKIEEQDRLLESLERSYDRLESAIEKAFGSDYIYNYTKQLEVLAAKQAAYEEQARLEGEKGKKADKDKIEGYKEAAEEAAEKIADMQGQLAEHFAGTDLTSAARDFATSWVDAYREFSSTTDAMKGKFQDMIQNMIVESLAAKLVEEQLSPIFDMIDRLSKDDGILSAKDIAEIAAETDRIIPNINNSLSGLMNTFASLGYNVRQGVGQFTGISRDIAGASEESINGLAAGVNTQNFYMQLISQNVASILAALTGSAEVSGPAGAAAVADPYKDQMLQYVGSLPQMRDDIAAMRSMWEKVIRPNGTSATHYVATR